MTRAAFFVCVLLAVPALASVSHAQAISGQTAKDALFPPVVAEVEILAEAGLPADQAQVLVIVGEGQPYYGAIAIAPEEGLMSEATVAAANFHDTAAATIAALAECNAKKKTATECVVAGYIRPKGWQDNGFALSSDASAAFNDYDMKSGAFAVSVTTGAFGMASGEGAAESAVQACVAKNEKATDCALVIAN